MSSRTVYRPGRLTFARKAAENARRQAKENERAAKRQKTQAPYASTSEPEQLLPSIEDDDEYDDFTGALLTVRQLEAASSDAY